MRGHQAQIVGNIAKKCDWKIQTNTKDMGVKIYNFNLRRKEWSGKASVIQTNFYTCIHEEVHYWNNTYRSNMLHSQEEDEGQQ